MRTRLAACETCRRSKLACDHERPACARCRHRGLRAGCIYRDRPFQRNTQRSSPRNSVSATASSPHAHGFPDSGFVDQIPSGIGSVNINWNDDDLLHGLSTSISQGILQDQGLVGRASRTLNQLIIVGIPKLHRLVFAWLDKKVNLPLAEPFVSGSADATLYLGNLISSTSAAAVRSGGGQLSSTWFSQHASWLLKNTRNPISLEREMTANAFLSQMLGNNLRWETLGIFFTAAARAAIDTVSFPSLYNNDQERKNLIKTLTSMGDWCLETCLSLDCLNDIQLILQYENFIVHSQVDGEQSYHSWRRMGDVASSLFALGYHEEIDEEAANIPIFVAELRRAVFARAYAADKSLAVFLGRPSRISKSYCTLQLPKNIPRIWNDETALENLDPGLPEIINYTSDTCCSARFASLKEDVLELFRHRNSGSETEQARSIIRQATEVQWQSLPAHFKLNTSLRDCHLEPFQRDFLVSRRLDYLHIFFLLHLISLKQTEPNEGILTVAGEMLSYAVEVVILRDRLVNSGTSIIFKVAQYGLPAAGIISLALLNNTVGTNRRPCSRSKFVQDLSVLVAGIRTGGVIQDGDPNFALFFQASRAIQSLLDFLMDWGPPQVGQPSSQHYSTFNPSDYWDSSAGFGPWHFDFEFWSKLAKHPNLLGHGHGA